MGDFAQGGIGILVAMAEEVAILRDRHFDAEAPGSGLCKLYETAVNGVPVVLAHSGMGKVNAAVGATELLGRYRPAMLLVSGLAGALDDELSAGDMVVASAAVQHDFDLTPVMRSVGQLPGHRRPEIRASARLASAAAQAAAAVMNASAQDGRPAPKFVSGLVASGDMLISSAERKGEILARFPEAKCVDMETAAVAQVAAAAGCEWAAIRIISDNADESFEATEVLDYATAEGAETISALLAALCGL